jgi:hypothetical protein
LAPHCTRVVIASLLGLAAACWPSRSDRDGGAPAHLGRIDLLAPRGRLDGAPCAIRWSTTQRVVRIRVRVLDDAGEPILERLTDEGRASVLALDDGERRRWSRARRCRIEVDGMAADGELVALGGPVATWIAPQADADPGADALERGTPRR